MVSPFAIKYPFIKTKPIAPTISKAGKSTWANSLEMLKDTSATTGRKVTTAEKTKPFSMPTKEDIFGKPQSSYYKKAQYEPGQTIGGEKRNWETRFEYSQRVSQERAGITEQNPTQPTWWEAYEYKRTGRKMLESWAMRKYKGLPSLRNLRPSKYPLEVYKPKIKGVEATRPSISQSFKQSFKPISNLKYMPVYGLGIRSISSTRTDTKQKIKPITYPMFKMPTITGTNTGYKQTPGYNFSWLGIPNINIPGYTPRPTQTPKIPTRQPPREPPFFRRPPPIPPITIPTFEFPNINLNFAHKKRGIRQRTIKTKMLTLKDLFGGH